MSEKLKIIPLGGLNEIGKNLTVYEYGNDIIVVDCGLGFPGKDKPGVDIVIPDVSYLIQNKRKLRGIFITHGHEDHIGALPYILRKIQAPIYATRMSAGLINLKLEEHQLGNSITLIECSAGDVIKAGCFQVEFIHVNHSIADAVAFAITCPVGVCVHTGDFKIDTTPIQGGMMDLGRLGELGKAGVLALLADSTNVEHAGYAHSESSVGTSLDSLFRGCEERIFVTTFSSNVDRVQQIINVAKRHGRKVAITGRSMENNIRVASELGYMTDLGGVLTGLNSTLTLPKEQVCIVTTGSQGEAMSALTRMAFGSHRHVTLFPGDRVILSASSIPGNAPAIASVIDELFRRGVEVLYERSLGLHVSGHACQEELKIVHGLVRPKFFIPIHGEQRMLQLHARLAQEMGTDSQNIVVSDIGHIIEVTPNAIRESGAVPSGEVMLDGYGQGNVNDVVLRDRQKLAEDGVIIVVLSVSRKDGSLIAGPNLITRGFVYTKDSEKLLQELHSVAHSAFLETYSQNQLDWASIKTAVRSAISHYLFRRSKRSPMILPIIAEI